MLNSDEAPLLWKTHESAPWRPLTGNHELVGIVKSFDPNGFLRLEVSKADIEALESEVGS
jgi:hypothetical protein